MYDITYTRQSASERVAVFSPQRRRSDIPVLFFHGGGGTPLQFVTDPPCKLPAAVAGYGGMVCYSGDWSGGNAWGNDPMLDSIDDVLAWGNTNYGTRTDKAAFVGLSHGASADNYCWRNPDVVAALLLIIPGVNYQDLWDRNPLGLIRPAMTSSFVPPYADAEAAFPDRDPVANAALHIPYVDRTAVWYGLDDTVADPDGIEEWIDAVGLADDNVHPMAGVGHDFDFDWQPLADWLVPLVRHTP